MIQIPKSEYARRRKALMAQMEPNSIAILPAAAVAIRNRDVEHVYRQDSDFQYLSGFPEPEAVIVLIPGREYGEYVLFCRERNPERELWDGLRAGQDGAIGNYGADDAFPINDKCRGGDDGQSVQRRLGLGLGLFVELGEQQQWRHAKVFHDFHVIAFAVFGLFQCVLNLSDGSQVLQDFGGFRAQRVVAASEAETCEETLAPLTQCSGAHGQWLIIAGQQQDNGHVVTGQFAFDHLLQTGQCLANIIFRLLFQQHRSVGKPAIGFKACASATATEQQAMQLGRRDRMTAAIEQGGEGVVRRILFGHGQLGAKRRNV